MANLIFLRFSNMIIQKIKYLWENNSSLLFIALITSIQSGNPIGLATNIPFWKYISSLLLWYAVFKFPYTKFTLKNYATFDKICIISMIILISLSIIKTPFTNDTFIYSNPLYGNKYISWIFNHYSILLFYPILFIGISTQIQLLRQIALALFITIFIVMILSLFSPFIENHVFYFIPLILPFFKRHKFILIIITIIFLLKACGVLGVLRVHTIYFALALIAYLLCFKIRNIKIIKILAIIITLLPLYFTVNALIYKESAFEKIKDYTNNQEIKEDTRTFLYKELYQDLIDNHSLWFGKGSHSFYYTEYFSKNDMYSYRNTSEVPILNLMLKVGLLYVLIYLILMLRAIYLAIWDSKSWYIKSCGIIMAGDFFLQFIGNMQGPYLYSIIIYTIAGISLSTYWRRMTNEDIIKAISANKNQQ